MITLILVVLIALMSVCALSAIGCFIFVILNSNKELKKRKKRGELFYETIEKWCNARDDIKFAFVRRASKSVDFIVVRNEVSYSEEFDDSLSQFDMRLNTNFEKYFSVHTLGLPLMDKKSVLDFAGDVLWEYEGR